MAVNLIRNARVFFSSFVDSTTGVLTTTGGMTNANTFELQVLDGMTFSQETNTETVTVNESGTSPNRGQQGFNTSLNPVSFSFSTYLKPAQASTANTAEEAPLWNALTSADTITTASSGWQDGTDPNPATVVLTGSDKNQLQKFALIISMDDQTFILENCALNEATIDFGLDGIATVAWSGQATSITRKSAALTFGEEAAGSLPLTAGGLTGSNAAKPRITQNCYYLANKLSTVAIVYGSTTYNLAITGGSFTYSNNISYLTPANIGVVNKPFTYFTGARAISGTFNAYLRTGTTNTGGLFDVLNTASATTDQPTGTFTMSIGGTGDARVVLEAPKAMFTLPAVNTDQVVGITINFTAMGADLDTPDEITLKYYAPPAA